MVKETVPKFQKALANGLLSNFIREKANAYIEPSRKGTPKGEVVGFSREKYLATLMALTRINLKSSAMVVGVSYGLLRKWRTEAEFRKAVEAHTKEFCSRFFEHARNKVIKWEARRNSLLKLPVAELVKEQIHGRDTYEEFADGDLYSRDLYIALQDVFVKTARTKKGRWLSGDNEDVDTIAIGEALWIFDLIREKQGRDTPFMDLLNREGWRMLKHRVNSTITRLSSREVTEEDLKNAVYDLKGVAYALERVERRGGGAEQKSE